MTAGKGGYTVVKSMTGYGRARQTLGKRDITVEVRAVNNRYLDCAVKLPRAYAFAEDAVRKHVQQAVSRGKVDILFTIDSTGADTAKIVVDRSLAEGYAAALRELERDGLVTRQEYLEVPVRVEYSPTDSCRELLPILEQLSDWAEKRM